MPDTRDMTDAVQTWIDSDESRLRFVATKARQAVDTSQKNEQPDSWSPEFTAERLLAATLKQWATNELLRDLGGGLAAELLRVGLSHVDWIEMAQYYIEGPHQGPQPDDR